MAPMAAISRIPSRGHVSLRSRHSQGFKQKTLKWKTRVSESLAQKQRFAILQRSRMANMNYATDMDIDPPLTDATNRIRHRKGPKSEASKLRAENLKRVTKNDTKRRIAIERARTLSAFRSTMDWSPSLPSPATYLGPQPMEID